MIKVKKLAPPAPPQPALQITLPWDTAVTLRSIFANIGGSPGGYRGQTDELNEALEKAGVPMTDRLDRTQDFKGSIYLQDEQ